MVFSGINIHAGNLNIADEFQPGDLVSADTFNQIFDTIEKINRTVVDADLIGVWSCNAMTSRNTPGWTSKGLFYILENSQVNLTASSKSTSLESAYTISTSSPSPFKRTLTSAFSGTYVLYNNKLFTKQTDESEARIWDVNIISPTRFELTFLETSAQSFPTNYASFITCDSAEAVPASPTSPTATNNKTGINLAWTDPSSDGAGFKIYRKLSTASEAELIATQTAVTYSDTDLAEGQTAYYYITTYNDNGESAKSKSVSATLDSIAPTLIAVTPPNAAALTDADADFTGGGGGLITITLTFSEEITVPCISTGGAGLCGGDSAVKFQGLNNTYSFLNPGTTGTTFSTTIPFTPTYGTNPDYFTVSVSGEKIQDKNGNVMEKDFSSTFSLSK